jgi:hypothetical protein
MQITTDGERQEFHKDAAERSCVPYQLRHSHRCDGNRDTEGTYRCTALAFVQEVTWRHRVYLVGVPTCRHSPMQKIVNAAEQFGCDVGWGSVNRSGVCATSDFSNPLVKRQWFPMMSCDAWLAFLEEITDACEPAVNVRYHTYYWKRDIARVVRSAARRRGRLRCAWCRTIYSWARYRNFVPNDPVEGYRPPPVLCDTVCERDWGREQLRIFNREWREREWLREGHRRLVEMRKLLKSPSELAKRRQRPHAV